MTTVVLVIGAGGTGKTTVCGALAAALADSGRRTLALTIDPALRLAQALGLSHLGNDPTAVPGAPGLDAAMLDAAASWESLARRHTDHSTAERLIRSRYFEAIAYRLPAGHAYAAAEEAVRLAENGGYDVIVVDTPPVGGAIEFFEAPRTISSLISGRALRLLTGPRVLGHRTLFRVTARPALRLADQVLGSTLLVDLGEFLLDLRTTYDGIRRRARIVQQVFDSADLIVTATPDAGPLRVARQLLAERPGQPTRLVINRVLPPSWADTPEPAAGPLWDNFESFAAEARRHRDVCTDLTASGIDLVVIPLLVPAPASRADLTALAYSTGLLAA